jgi:hypothetical protein
VKQAAPHRYGAAPPVMKALRTDLERVAKVDGPLPSGDDEDGIDWRWGRRQKGNIGLGAAT